MTSEALYYNFQLLVNKNASLKNVHIPRGNFVFKYNRESLFWLADYITKHGNTESIHDIADLLFIDVPVSFSSSNDKKYNYILPDNYFQFVGSWSEAENKKGCINKVINYLQKPREILPLLDESLPSFDFEESICNIADKKLVVFVDDYKLNNTYLSYYSIPEKIDLEGYVHLDSGLPSTTIDQKLDDIYQFQILDRVALEFQREMDNNNQVNILQTKIQQQ